MLISYTKAKKIANKLKKDIKHIYKTDWNKLIAQLKKTKKIHNKLKQIAN